MIDRICTILSLVVCLVSLLFCGYCLNRTKIAEARLMEIGSSLRKEMKETESKCQRYSDACVDLIAKGVWINGEQ